MSQRHRVGSYRLLTDSGNRYSNQCRRLPDVVTDGKTGYVVESKNPEQIADAVIRYFKEEKEEEFAQNVKAEEYKYSWDRMTEVVEELWAR